MFGYYVPKVCTKCSEVDTCNKLMNLVCSDKVKKQGGTND